VSKGTRRALLKLDAEWGSKGDSPREAYLPRSQKKKKSDLAVAQVPRLQNLHLFIGSEILLGKKWDGGDNRGTGCHKATMEGEERLAQGKISRGTKTRRKLKW